MNTIKKLIKINIFIFISFIVLLIGLYTYAFFSPKLDIKLPHTEIYGNPDNAGLVTIQGSDEIGVIPNLTKPNQTYVVAVRETANDCYLNSLQIHQSYYQKH